ncbi:signal peptidase I [Halosegnis longus]|uniref:signal peptidase I n=1 Tax=Halosegnis longus TaxID=2216012 RepID=UPI0013146FBD|nr:MULTISPECIES: signal peptidase I [Halobacteriales]
MSDSPMRRGIAVAVTLALVVAVVPFVLFAVPGLVGAEHAFVVLSGSMEPALSPGDIVFVDADAAIATGDVITYAGGDVPITHRVIDTVDGGYLTQGDANEDPDSGVVAADTVLGEVAFSIPVVGRVVLWANTSLGYLALVVVPLFLLVANELFEWARRGDDEESDADAPIPAIRPIDDSPSTQPTQTPEPSDSGMVAVALVDLKLTVLALGILLAYAAWNIRAEFGLTGAPDPISVGAATAGLVGILFTGWVTFTAWRTARVSMPTPVAQTDGGVEVDDE